MIGPAQQHTLVGRDRLGNEIQSLEPLRIANHRFQIFCHAHLTQHWTRLAPGRRSVRGWKELQLTGDELSARTVESGERQATLDLSSMIIGFHQGIPLCRCHALLILLRAFSECRQLLFEIAG